jgi:hypothetical protein
VNNEVTEIAKATQEVAKTTRTGIEAAQEFGGFLGRVLGEPIETAVGMVSDRLKFMRIERRMRLADRYDQIMVQRELSSEEQPVPAKIAVPAIENASLEEDDELQDLWANLLASAHDKTLNGVVRSAFVDIIKQLEVVDVHILNYIYSDTMEKNIKGEWGNKRILSWEPKYDSDDSGYPVLFGVRQFEVQVSLRISRHVYECAVDNLVRVRCLAPYVEDVDVPGEYPETASRVHEYEWVSITRFGCDFVRCCTLPPHIGANE